jgi:hypothetical protein
MALETSCAHDELDPGQRLSLRYSKVISLLDSMVLIVQGVQAPPAEF